jgi:thiamine kinase-like enzyme
MDTTFDINDIYFRLGLRIISDKESTRIINNLYEHYNISYCSLYNPNQILFTNFILSSKTLNNNNKLYKLIQKKRRISVIGYMFKALIKNRSNKIFYKNVFVKEIPIFDPQNIGSYYDHIENSTNNPTPQGQLVYNNMYSTHKNTNIETFINYLVSKLVELNVIPHFCECYGSYMVNMKKFTYDVGECDSILDNMDNLLKDSRVRCVSSRDDIYLEYDNVPIYLIVTEAVQYDIDYLQFTNIITYDMIVSIIFQVFASILTMYSIFGIKHNDFHLGNIMFKPVQHEYIYYKCNSIYYKVPTYGYMVKIIDWGRGTYQFNEISGNNDVFNGLGECFEQYVYSRLNNKGAYPVNIDDNHWTDIIMVSQCFLNEFKKQLKDTDLERLLFKQITTVDKKKLEVCHLSWDMYVKITNSQFKINPREILTNRVFQKYKVKLSKITNVSPIYHIIV